MANERISAERLKKLFSTHPKVKTFYATSDGKAFIEKHHAESHAGGLNEKDVQPYNRFVMEKVEELKARVAAKSGTEKAESEKDDTNQNQDSNSTPEADGAAGTAKDEGQTAGSSKPEPTREELVARYTELYNKVPFPANMKVETLKEKIAAKEAELTEAQTKTEGE